MTNESDDPLASYVEVTLEALVVAHLQDCANQLQSSQGEALRLFLAARSIHLALTTALTSAVAGSAGHEAYRAPIKRQWEDYFTRYRTEELEPPNDDHMMSFKELLAAATSENPPGFLSEPLRLSEDDKIGIDRLTALRNWTEHPRPDLLFLEPRWIASAILAGLRLTDDCFRVVSYRLNVLDWEIALKAGVIIRTECSRIYGSD